MKLAKVKIINCIAVVVLMSATSMLLSAQPYEHSVGVRAGYSSGIVYKAFFRHRPTAIEGGLLYNRHGFSLNALADPALILNNYSSSPTKEIDTLKMVQERKQKKKK